MYKDVPANPEDQSGVSLFSQIVRGKAWKWNLFLGATGGIAMGILNLSAAVTESRLQGLFDTLSYPAIFLTYIANDRLGFMNGKSSGVCEFYLLIAVICYWVFIGLFLSSVPCLARDWTCRCALLIGAFGGLSTGYLNFMTTVGQWEGPRSYFYFDILGRSGSWTFRADKIQVEILFSLVAGIVYWTLIGLVVASLFCVIRIVKNKKLARRILVSEE